MSIEITVRDTGTGETGRRTIDGDNYMVITTGRMYLAHTTKYRNGTQQLTLKLAKITEDGTEDGSR